MLRNAKTLEGYQLHARDGDVGRVRDVYFDDARWQVRYFVVDTGAWLTGRSVLISSAALTAPDWESRRLSVDLTKEQVRNSPAVDTAKPISRQHEEELHRYYAWPYYWTAPMLGGAFIAPPVVPVPPAVHAGDPSTDAAMAGGRDAFGVASRTRETSNGDPHLRSASEVRGYAIEATDRSLGHVEDFVIDDQTWAVRCLLVDTRNWWPGKKVLVTLPQIAGINWADRTLMVNLSSEAIKQAPESEGGQDRPVPSEFIDRLEAHYRGPNHRAVTTENPPGSAPRIRH